MILVVRAGRKVMYAEVVETFNHTIDTQLATGWRVIKGRSFCPRKEFNSLMRAGSTYSAELRDVH